MAYILMTDVFGGKILKITTLILISSLLVLFFLAVPVNAAQYGDINRDGKINVQDVTMIMQHVLGLKDLSEKEKILADVNGDDAINVQDAALIMQKALGLIDEFPALPDIISALIEDFIVAEGLTPGKKIVVVILNVSEPDDYEVRVGGTKLKYQDSAGGFRGEVNEEDAEISKVEITDRN